MTLCAICGSGRYCPTHDSNREAIDIGRPAGTVGLPFDPHAGTDAADCDEDDYDLDYDLDQCQPGRDVETVELPGVSR